MNKLYVEVDKKIVWKFVKANGGWSSRWISEKYKISNDNGYRRYDLFSRGLKHLGIFNRVSDAKLVAELLVEK